MIIVTGAMGFIGSNIVKKLNAMGCNDILAVDDLTDGTRFKNLVDCKIADYLNKDDFLKIILAKEFKQPIEAIFHQGACSDTTEWNGRFMLQNNYEYSKVLLHYCLENNVPFIYASSAAIYGDGKAGFKEAVQNEQPLNVYGYSKFLFDQYVRKYAAKPYSQVVGLRYFNVYGPREQHKGSMASVAFHLNKQLLAGDPAIKLFVGSDGYGNGEQRRDFVYVDDVAQVNVWFWKNPNVSGIFNVGTGRSQTFNDVARAVIAWHGRGHIEYIPFPEHLKGRYQSFTQANIDELRKAGYQAPFKTVEEGVQLYLDWLNPMAVKVEESVKV